MQKLWRISPWLWAAMLLVTPANAEVVSLDFETDPVALGIEFFGTAEWRNDGGNPGGYLAVTDAIDGQRGAIVFPELGAGGVLQAFEITADLRVGGGTDLPADGFSFNFVEPDDPLIDDGEGYAGTTDIGAGESNLPEEGSLTGVSVGFDEWFSGGEDVIGLSVRLDGEIVTQVELPVANGDVDDIESLQTGPACPDCPFEDSIADLGWAPFGIKLQNNNLQVHYKGETFLDEPIDWQPSAGRLVFGGRTGGSNANHHIDNIVVRTDADVNGGGGVGGHLKTDPALVGVWLFDEGQGEVVGDIINGNDGDVIDGDFSWDAGKFGGAIVANVDGSIDVQDSDSIAEIGEQLTVAAWFRIDADSDTGIRKQGAFLLEDQSGSEPVPDGFSFRIWTDQGISPGFYGQTELVQGEWYHVAGTYDGENVELYINGEPESVEGALSDQAADWDPVWGGDIQPGEVLQLKYGPEPLTGAIDEAVIFSRALSQEEIQALMGGWENLGAGGGATLQAGDANQDLEFNQLDLVQVQIAGKYLTGNAATWGDGDWNAAPGGSPGSPPAGDGLFDQLDIIAALNAGVYLTGPYAAIADGGVAGDGQTSVSYNPDTGEVAVDAPAGTELTSINIDSAGGIFTGEAATSLGGSFDNDADGNIFKATFGGSFGSVSFGNVAQTGLAKDFVLGDLTVVGSLAGGGDLGNVDLIYIPEPGSLLLLLLGVLSLVGGRRQRS